MNGPRPSIALAVLAIMAGTPAVADNCTVRVNAMDVVVNTDLFGEGTTIRENMLSWPRRSLNALTGTLPTCPSDVTLDFMAGIEGLPNTNGYCLAEGDATTGWLLVPGPRDYRGRCAVSACQRINGAADDIVGLTNRMALMLYAPPNPESEVMAHASGVMIMTLGQKVIQDKAEELGSAALTAAIASPMGLSATALSVVAVGGTMWMCNS